MLPVMRTQNIKFDLALLQNTFVHQSKLFNAFVKDLACRIV